LLGLGDKAIQEEGGPRSSPRRSLTKTKATVLLTEAQGVRERAATDASSRVAIVESAWVLQCHEVERPCPFGL
jgi:hypothetical protein